MKEIEFYTAQKDDFENSYLEVRKKEGFVYLDDEVKNLPQLAKDNPQYKVWKQREQNADAFCSYIKDRNLDNILEIGCGNGWFSHLIATNNEAEYMGALGGIKKAISLNIRNIKVFGDSKLIIEQIKGNWKCKSANLKPIHAEIKKLLHNFNTIEFAHVYRKNNKRADELANLALDIALSK